MVGLFIVSIVSLALVHSLGLVLERAGRRSSS
jgi:hypothetical protein